LSLLGNQKALSNGSIVGDMASFDGEFVY